MKTIDDFIQLYCSCPKCGSACFTEMDASGHPEITVNKLKENSKEIYLSLIYGAPATADRFKINIYDNACEGKFEKFKDYSGRTFIQRKCLRILNDLSLFPENEPYCDFYKVAILEFDEKSYSIKPYK